VFASIRRYRVTRGSMDELTRRADRGFAQEISARPGFVSYEFVDPGDREIVTISLFREHYQAEESAQLAQQWTADNLRDMEFHRIETLDGRVMVSRAADEMLEAAHPGAAGKFATIRRYALRAGDVVELMHTVDQVFADQISGLDGFEAYHALDCGRGEVLSISLFRDQSAAEDSDEQALQFVRKHLSAFDIERSEVIGGEVRISRASSELLEPAHA
jgi:heme-degrading monooxygenase HmoA